MAANHEDCLTSLQSCFSTREIYSCIVDCFFFLEVGGAAAGRYKTAHRRRGKKFKKKKSSGQQQPITTPEPIMRAIDGCLAFTAG